MKVSVKAYKCLIVASLIFVLFRIYNVISIQRKSTFVADYLNNTFVKDGKTFNFVSGSLHYFRVPHQLWFDRLIKLRASGVNVVSTYVAWNIHEPQKGQFNFNGDADIINFIKIAQSVGLLVNIRPGPYICSEWDLGGIPYFVLGTPSNPIKLRTMDQQYIEFVDNYFAKLLPMLQPFLYENGGPIILVQVENEYGSYSACNSNYMNYLSKLMREYLGDNVVLYTADGWDMHHLICGPIHNSDVLTTVNFGPNSDHLSAFSRLRAFQKHGPLVNSEFYPGWLDHWGDPHQCKTPQYVDDKFKELLNSNMGNIYVNFYMFFGGTNFGFYNGANMVMEPLYQPDPTSYDYDAPLTESGDFTDKYFAIRNTIKKYRPELMDNNLIPNSPLLANSIKKGYGKVSFHEVLLFPRLKELATKEIQGSPTLLTFEDLKQDYGFVLYEQLISQTREDVILDLDRIKDMAYVFADDIFIGKIYRLIKI